MSVMILRCDAGRLPLAAESVHAVVTSPPYWAMRRYDGPAQDRVWGGDPAHAHAWNHRANDCGEISRKASPGTWGLVDRGAAWRGPLGLEPTPSMFVEHLVVVMREVRRVLRRDGTLWMNLGDSYLTDNRVHAGAAGDGVKAKDLIGIPWRVALAMQKDDWFLRSEVIWHKPNPLPESVRDRPCKSHEHLFLLAPSARYYYDDVAVRVRSVRPGAVGVIGSRKYQERAIGPDDPEWRGGGHDQWAGRAVRTRGLRTLWTIATRPFRGAHFALFPSTLVEPCILAGTSERGACTECGRQWRRVVERGRSPAPAPPNGTAKHQDQSTAAGKIGARARTARAAGADHDSPFAEPRTLGWEAACRCGAGVRPSVVLDPFAGTGTVGRVAIAHRRQAVLCDLSAAYLGDLARARTRGVQLQLEGCA